MNRYDFMQVECHFSSFPRNVKGSIIYPYNCITLLDAIRAEETYHEFLPMFTSLDEMIYGEEGDDEVLEQDIIVINAEDLEFQRSSTSGLDRSIVRCYKCGQSVLKPVTVDTQGTTIVVHEECYKCMCGAEKDLVYDNKIKGFLCSKAWQCGYIRRCYVCDYFVMDKDRLRWKDVFLHSKCIQCSCKVKDDSGIVLSANKAQCSRCNTVRKKVYMSRTGNRQLHG